MNQESGNSSGIFDKPAPPSEPQDNISLEKREFSENKPELDVSKKDFKDPFASQVEEIRAREQANRKPLDQVINQTESAAEKTAEALNRQGQGNLDLEESDKISDKDLKLAEQVIFNGFAEFDVSMPNIPNVNLTICSTSAEEMSIIDEIAFDMVKNAKAMDDGTLDMPQNHVTTMRNALYVALSYKGKNREELMPDQRAHLNTLKKGIQKVSDLYSMGKMKDAEDLKEQVKQALLARATAVNRMPTPMIDFLSGEKYDFDQKVATIMRSKNVLPKS